MPQPTFVSVAEAALEPWPLEPAQILAGRPQARGKALHEGPGDTGCGVWECTPGTFVWSYELNQSMVLTAGEAEIAVEGGERFTVRVGDAAFFPAGTRATWIVKETVRKLYTIYA